MTPARMAALHAACFRVPPPWRAADFAACLDDPACLVVTAGDAGFALGRVAGDEAELLTLAVAPGARRRGHGRRLLTVFEGRAAMRGARRAVLEVTACNRAARTLYGAAGYSVAGRRPALYRGSDGAPVDALTLARALAPETG